MTIGGEFNPTLNISLLIVGAPIFIFLMVIFAKASKRKFQEEEKKYTSTEIPKWEEKKQQWEKATQRWKCLYYCARDGIVYDPDTGEVCDPTSLNDFVYRQL